MKTKISDYVDKIYYINLDKRIDRKESIQKEIKKIDPNLEKTLRLAAVEFNPGAIGCGLSHINALNHAIENNFDNIIILEDDFKFVVGENFNIINDSFNHLFENYSDFNICLLAGRSKGHINLDKYINEVIEAKTTAGYLINKRFFISLRDCFNNAVTKMKKEYIYAQAEIDTEWKSLQGIGKKFYMFNHKPGYQMASYSDIEKRFVSYNC